MDSTLVPEFDFRGVPVGMPGYYIGIVLAGVFGVAGLVLPLTTALLALEFSSFLFLFLPKRKRFLLYSATLPPYYRNHVRSKLVMEQILAPHQQVRIKVLLGLSNPSGAGYNTLQSLIAIGSGGWTGKGFFVCFLKLNWFCSCTEYGLHILYGWRRMELLGTFLLASLWTAHWPYNMACWYEDNFSRFYGYGVASIFFTHWVINISMIHRAIPNCGYSSAIL